MASHPLLLSPRSSSSSSSATPSSPFSPSLTFPSHPLMQRKTVLSHELCGNFNGGGIRFGTETKAEDDSGVCSPPLWKTSPSTSPKSGNSPPHMHQHRRRSLSPASRTQAIARGRRELMDMVRNMPETSYELSLKDLVEQSPVEVRRESYGEETNFLKNEGFGSGKKKKKKKSEKAPQMKRSGSIDNGGFLLKLVFPIKLGSKKRRKKKNSATNTCAKVSPKPPASDGSGKGGDKEWWKHRSSKSSSRTSSGNSGSTRSTGSSSTSSVNRCVKLN